MKTLALIVRTAVAAIGALLFVAPLVVYNAVFATEVLYMADGQITGRLEYPLPAWLLGAVWGGGAYGIYVLLSRARPLMRRLGDWHAERLTSSPTALSGARIEQMMDRMDEKLDTIVEQSRRKFR